MTDGIRHVVLVTGLSGAGKGTILRGLEDNGFAAVDNPPLALIETLVGDGGPNLAIGIDARTEGFDSETVLRLLRRLRTKLSCRVELVFATATAPVLLRRFTATRRRHPLARDGRVADAIAEEQALTARLRQAADLVLDTSDLPIPSLRRLVRDRLAAPDAQRLALTLVSFAFPRGLPLEADMVFDARFLKNPHYDPTLQPMTGLDPQVAAFVRDDIDYTRFVYGIETMSRLVLPRFVREGKTYATLAIGCSGGRHRSVTLVEELARRLGASASDGRDELAGIRITVLHRELHDAGADQGAAIPAALAGAGMATS